MQDLLFRQVHLDFHTSEHINDIGARFDKEQFQNALKIGHVNSITLFSKCHHGWSYHPTTANEMHPNLKFDLLGAQLEACKEIGVKAPIYISAGLDQKYAMRHPEHIRKPKPDSGFDFLNIAMWRRLCFNTPYLDVLVAQVEEVMQRYNPCGVFLDICMPQECYCQNCVETMRANGLDPLNPDDMKVHIENVYNNYCRRIEEAVRKYNPDTTIFHNGGHIIRGKREHINYDTHLELESLPTGGWGYDHFPISAAYARILDKQFLGMTGKFHNTWGEFGGYKHPNALRYETALSVALGGKCSIGDQLHPSGEMNTSTYTLIGKAYKEIESKEPYLKDTKHISDIAILSAEAFTDYTDRNAPYDIGASRMLLESNMLFDLVDQHTDLSKYRLILLPDVIRIDDALKTKIDNYLANGGKIICTGESGLHKQKDAFALDLAVEYEGVNEFKPNYMIPNYDLINGKTAYVMYSTSYNIKANGKVRALLEGSYFNRTPEHFCSHQHTPNNLGKQQPGVVVTQNTAYVAWNIFREYANFGSYHLKELMVNIINELLPIEDRSVNVNLPDRGIVTYFKQKNRYITHLLFAHTTIRGKNTEIIEDIVPLNDIHLSVKLPSEPRKVVMAEYINDKLQETSLEFSYKNGRCDVNIDKFEMHAMIVFEI